MYISCQDLAAINEMVRNSSGKNGIKRKLLDDEDEGEVKRTAESILSVPTPGNNRPDDLPPPSVC